MSTAKARKGTAKKVVAGIAVPQRLHLDKRIPQILAADADKSDEDPLTTKEEAAWLQVSEEWLENGRIAGYPSNKPMAVGHRADHLRELLVHLQRRHAEIVEFETEIAWRHHA